VAQKAFRVQARNGAFDGAAGGWFLPTGRRNQAVAFFPQMELCAEAFPKSWAVSVDEAERDARAGAAVAVEAERRRPAHVPGQRPLSRF
jgi:hypothetical protein